MRRFATGLPWFVLFALACAMVCSGARAAGASAPAASASQAATAAASAASAATAGSAAANCPAQGDVSGIAVTGVSRLPAHVDSAASAPVATTVRLRDEISVSVRGLPKLLKKEQCSPQRKKIVLYLDGRPLTDRLPYPPVDPSGGALNFALERNETSRDVWTHLLGHPEFGTRSVPVSVGLQDEFAVDMAGEAPVAIALEVIPARQFGLWCAVFVGLVIVFWVLAVKSNLLRDSGPNGPNRKPYSLARTQMAFWFFIVLASYLFIGIITGDWGTSITGTVLSLMGISAGTTLGSSVMDPKVPRPPVGGGPMLPVVPQSTTGHWYLDILTDQDGVSFHRFQMAAWTLVLGIIFIQQVYEQLAMPNFDASLLAVLGISSGTYLGMKSTSEN